MDKHKGNWLLEALIIIGGTLLLGGIATFLGGKIFNFDKYDMPSGVVPDIVFPIAWAIIYLAIGISTFLVWRDKEIKRENRKTDVIWFAIHMFFNILWPLFFFRLGWIIVACVNLAIIVITAIIVMYRYYDSNLPAGIIFTIYVAWLIYAMYLNLGIVILNV